MSKKHMGSRLDDFLKGEGIFEEAQDQAIKEVIAWKLAKAKRAAAMVGRRVRVDLVRGPAPAGSASPTHSASNASALP